MIKKLDSGVCPETGASISGIYRVLKGTGRAAERLKRPDFYAPARCEGKIDKLNRVCYVYKVTFVKKI